MVQTKLFADLYLYWEK